MKLLALLLVLVPVLLARVGPAFAEDPPGVTTMELTIAEPIEFPPDTAIFIATGCLGCDAYDAAIYRVSRLGYGPVRVDLVFSPEGREGFAVTGFAVADDGMRMFASLLDSRVPQRPEAPEYPGETAFYWSDDGGMTWTQIGRLRNEGILRAVPPLRAEAVLATGPVYRDGTALGPFEFREANMVYRYADGEPLTAEELLLVGRSAPKVSIGQRAEDFLPGEPGVRLSFVQPDGSLRHFLSHGFVGEAGRLTEGVLAATILQRTEFYYRPRPSLVDTAAGVVYPISGPFDVPPLGGRNAIKKAIRGPFLRVATSECLPLRAWADAFASVTACAAPGVLLRPAGGVRYEHGVEWREVSLPNGTPGWVPRGSVEE